MREAVVSKLNLGNSRATSAQDGRGDEIARSNQDPKEFGAVHLTRAYVMDATRKRTATRAPDLPEALEFRLDLSRTAASREDALGYLPLEPD